MTVETVTPWLADRVLANDRPGVRHRWPTPPRMIARFLLAAFRKSNLFSWVRAAV